MLPVEAAFKPYSGLDGLPLQDGYVYFGHANQNPCTSPVTVYWDAAGTQPADQPIRTINGYLTRNGTPSNVFFTGSYSELVQDKRKMQVYYARNSDDFSLAATISALLGSGGAASICYQNTQLSQAILGTLADRIYDVNAVADFGADPTGMSDSTVALTKFFDALYDGCYAIIPPGLYLYTPILGSGTGIGYLNMDSVTSVNLFGYGAVIKNSFSVTVAPSTQGTLYGVHLLSCTDCNVHGLKFDGNRNTSYGTNADGNEFYSGFYVSGSTRCKLINCIGVNCQGDGASFNRINGNTGFNNDCGIIGGYYGGNRRNEISVGGDYGWTIDGGVTLFGSSDAHRTNPKAGLDFEWEHATIGPTGNNQRIYVGNVSCSGTMAGGGLYIARGAGITVGEGFRTYGLLGSSINIDNTATGHYETQKINIGACQLDSVYGIGITGGAGISIKGTYIDATYPLTINSPLTNAPYQWVADIDGCTLIGESVYAISVVAGRTKFTNNTCINCSSGGANNYMGLFVPLCEVQGNTFTRDTNQSAPGYGLIFATSNSVVSGNNISSAAITHVISYGQNSVPCYPAMQNNFYNGSLLPDTVATKQVTTQIVDLASAVPAMLYTPFFGNNTEIDACLLCISAAGTNIASTTKIDIGIVTDTNAYLDNYTVSTWDLGDVLDITGAFASLNTVYGSPIFITPTPGNNNPKVQFNFTLRTNRAGLYTSSVLFG